jgi:hypothetical protein
LQSWNISKPYNPIQFHGIDTIVINSCYQSERVWMHPWNLRTNKTFKYTAFALQCSIMQKENAWKLLAYQLTLNLISKHQSNFHEAWKLTDKQIQKLSNSTKNSETTSFQRQSSEPGWS